MGNTETAVLNLRTALVRLDRTYTWLSRESGVPYKRLLAEIKHAVRPIALETAIAAGAALGMELPELLEEQPAALAKVA